MMLRTPLLITTTVVLAALAGACLHAAPVGTSFTYHGQLTEGGQPASGIYDFRFAIYDVAGGGSLVAGPITNSAVAVANGLFTATLDFGDGVFTGEARWLEIGVRTNGSLSDFTVLSPLPAVTATPYALYTPSAGVAATATTAAVASGTEANAVNAASLQTDSVTTEKILDGTVTDADISPSGISADKIVGGDLQAQRLKVGAGHTLTGPLGSIAGGFQNSVTHDTWSVSSIGGGQENQIQGAASAVIGGGFRNAISEEGWGAAIVGGQSNRVQATQATIGGGEGNLIASNAGYAAIAGGSENAIGTNSNDSAIGGGHGNTVGDNSRRATIAGGNDNAIADNAPFATIPGGHSNAATNYAFAAGNRAQAIHTGAFVWADSTDADFASTTNNQFNVRATGGVRFDTGGTGVEVNGNLTAQDVTASNLVGVIAASQLTGVISSNNIGAGSITMPMIASGAVGADQLAAGAVTTSALADGAVTAAKMATVVDEGSPWALTTITNPTPQTFDAFGYAVAGVGSDRVLIGAIGDDTGSINAGAAYLFSTDGTLLTTFTNPTPEAAIWFAYEAAAVGSDRVLIGAEYASIGATNAGAAYLFSTDGTLLTTFTNPTPAYYDRFGSAVAGVGSDRVLIGAAQDDTGANNAGAAYLFSADGTLLTTFTNPTPASGDSIGSAVAALGTGRVLINAYLFSTSGTLLTTFTNPTLASGNAFGSAVAGVGSDRVLIAAPGDDTGATDAGAAYLYSTNGTLLTVFTNPTPADYDGFGHSVAAVGDDRVLIGADYDDTGADNAGAVYLFNTDGTLLTTFTNPTPASSELFGWSVAGLGSGLVVIGAKADDTGANDAGAVYLFQLGSYVPGLVAEGVRSGAITADSIADGAVDSSNLAAGAVTSASIADGAVTFAQLAPGAVGTAQLAVGAVTAVNIASNTITAQQLADGSVTSAKLTVGAVGTAQLAAGAVTTANIAADAIAAGQIAPGAVITETIAPGAIGALQLADGAVTAGKIASNSITAAQLAPGAVTTVALANGAVTSGKLASGAVGTAQLGVGAVTTATIASNAVTAVQLAAGAALSNLTQSGQSAVPSGGMVLSSNYNDGNLLNAGYVKLGKARLGDVWEERAAGAPAARIFHTAVWTGSEMIVWGGFGWGGFGFGDLNNGGRYSPSADSWSPVTTTNAPNGRTDHTAVWTGSEMIVWGGYYYDAGYHYLGDGGRYDPAANSWTAVSTIGAPSARSSHRAVWTGSEMIVWGGYSSGRLNDGGRYNPVADSWSAMSTNGAPIGRIDDTAVWTGSQMIVWGGYNGSYLSDGGRYDPASNSWTAVSTSGKPAGRRDHTAVWTGSEMIVWGGYNNYADGGYLNNGGRYNPTANSWSAVTTSGAPIPRAYHTAVWTGSEMIVWGGWYYGTDDHYFNDGGRYDPAPNSWTAVSTSGTPAARRDHTAVWTGSEMIVWGGFNGWYLDDTFSYIPTRILYLYQRP